MKYLIVSIIILISASISHAEDYWGKLQKRANELYGGWDVSVTLNAGMEHREYFRGTHSGPYGNVEIQVPLYSKEKRIAYKKTKTEYLQRGAELIKSIEEKIMKIKIQQEKEKILRAAMFDEGLEGIKAYYECKEEIVKLEAELNEAKRKLDAMLE